MTLRPADCSPAQQQHTRNIGELLATGAQTTDKETKNLKYQKQLHQPKKNHKSAQTNTLPVPPEDTSPAVDEPSGQPHTHQTPPEREGPTPGPPQPHQHHDTTELRPERRDHQQQENTSVYRHGAPQSPTPPHMSGEGTTRSYPGNHTTDWPH